MNYKIVDNGMNTKKINLKKPRDNEIKNDFIEILMLFLNIVWGAKRLWGFTSTRAVISSESLSISSEIGSELLLFSSWRTSKLTGKFISVSKLSRKSVTDKLLLFFHQ